VWTAGQLSPHHGRKKRACGQLHTTQLNLTGTPTSSNVGFRGFRFLVMFEGKQIQIFGSDIVYCLMTASSSPLPIIEGFIGCLVYTM
jgi:hypothetical protein